MATDPDAAKQFRDAASYLGTLGLGALFTVDADGNPSGWLWQQILGGVDTQEELIAAIESTDVWQDRFAVIVEQRKRRNAGQPVYVMTPEEVLEYENTTAQTMRRFGLPSWFYDETKDFDQLILSGLSAVEVEDRIAGAYNTVVNLDPDITAEFKRFYGVDGEAALVAYFLDPDKTDAQLEKVALAAYAGGVAKDFGLTLERDQAELFSLYDRTEAGIVQDLTEINAQSMLTSEGFGEAEDLTTDIVFDAVVRGDAESRSLLERRLMRRQANNRAGAGGGLTTNEGLIGVGSAS